METTFDRTEGGDYRWTVTLTGGTDVFRHAINMLHAQVEFCEAGARALADLRSAMGRETFDPWAKALLGERYRLLRHYWEDIAAGGDPS